MERATWQLCDQYRRGEERGEEIWVDVPATGVGARGKGRALHRISEAEKRLAGTYWGLWGYKEDMPEGR